ncbi:MAG: flagellar biosynthesis protein FlhA, partial [Polyangiales bacterium]
VNVLGGLAIGVGMRDMGAGDALATYGLLTIGDGLVSQIPALLISVSAGLVVTRVASEGEDSSLGGDVAAQVFGQPKALQVASAFLLVLAVVPGLPALPFLVLAGLFFGLARRLASKPAPTEATAVVAKQEAARETKARKQMVPLVVPVAVEVGDGLAEVIADGTGAGPFLEHEVPLLRDRLFLDLGLQLPGVRARSVGVLEPTSYVLALQEVPVARGELRPDRLICTEAPAVIASYGVSAEEWTDPVTGRPGALVEESAREVLEADGLEVLTPAAQLARHLGAVVRRRATPFVGLQETQSMLDQLERAYPALVRNVVPKPVSLALLADVLRRLVEEGISIRPLREILEALAIHAPNERDPVTLTELVRAALKNAITHQHAPDGVLAVYLLDPMIEDAVRDAIQRTAAGSYLALPPQMARDIVGSIATECRHDVGGAVVLTQADIRRFVRRLVEVELPDLKVLSYQELSPEAQVQPLGRVGL